ncbi:MAG: prepilin-type N-terminal cleavage/methylation domain-containing protein [Fibrobacter sp.]|nr:prepilin-type N-terminal cleavage/methylation domain-containing protein [Fibrobacter sp.]
MIKKQGFTLIEVLVVVSIMGILSSVGVVSFVSAVANARIKDSTFNTKAFVETVAQEAKRVNETLCLKKTSDTRLTVYKGECSSAGSVFSTFDIEAPSKFVTGGCPTGASTNWIASGTAEFKPKIGLSAAPSEGCIMVRYGSDSRYGAVVKQESKNFLEPLVSYDGSSWSGI